YLLASGTTALASVGAIVKRLRSVETLGATSAINSDKTGTLTLNQMTAVEMAVMGQRYTISGSGYATDGKITHVAGLPATDLEPYLLPMALASDAVAKDGALVGDPTEGALVVLAAKGGIDATTTREQYPRLATLPPFRARTSQIPSAPSSGGSANWQKPGPGSRRVLDC
ncbi:MAG TPA: ATPase, partial [Patescibacteria group bacterium]|nr:ATPase [Patescibacteria group bacterium]